MRADWSGLRAWFGASSHARAAELVGAVAELLPDGGPDFDVRADGVRVTARDERERQAVSAAAAGLGLVADPGGLQELRLRFDSAAPASVRPFWRTALDYREAGADMLADGLRRGPAIRFARSDDARPLRNRIHVDVGHPGPTAAAVPAIEGGRVVLANDWYSTVADPDGNEVDVVPGGALAEGSDWSVLFGAMACYPGASPRQAADLAAAAGRLADDAGIPLMVDVRPEAVVFDSGKDRWEAAGFAELAAAVQDAARAAGLAADNGRLRFVQAGIDAVDVPAVRAFWRAVLGYEPVPDPRITDLVDPRQLNPVVFFQPMDAGETDRRRQRNRTSVELLLPPDQLRARVDAAVAAGGRVLDGDRLADPEGNEVLLRG